jgi:hypothetical protein
MEIFVQVMAGSSNYGYESKHFLKLFKEMFASKTTVTATNHHLWITSFFLPI